MNVLFVCSGNISRSFLAEMLFRNEVSQRNLSDISVSSAGLFAYPGNPPDPKMVEYLSEKEIAIGKFQARQMTKEDAVWADLILVMEKEHERIIGETWPESKGKVEHLGRFAVTDPHVDDIIDPYGRSPYHYRLTQAQITLAIKSLVNSLGSRQTKD